MPSRAPQHNLVPAAVNSISTYQTFNLRLSETDPSSKSIMQFTESIFHLVLHVWGEPSFWELQSGFFLPFWFFWFVFCLVEFFFSFLSQMINVSHWLFFLLLWWFDWLCKAKMNPVPYGSIWRSLLIQLTLKEILCGRKLVKTAWWGRNSAHLNFSSLCHCTDLFHKHPWE